MVNSGIAFRSCCLKFLAGCASNKHSAGYRMMPKRFLQAPPKKKIKLSHRSLDMAKPKTGTLSAKDDKKRQGSNNERTNDGALDHEYLDVKVENLEIPVKSENDKKEYRVIKLPNGLTALLIADPSPLSQEDDNDDDDDESEDDGETGSEDDDDESSGGEDEEEGETDEIDDGSRIKRMEREEKMAACGLCIGVGSFSDPPEIPGMAHFLEHLVFMGSKKYPQENDFDAFIKKRGGSDSAHTECEQTTFYFEVQEKYLYNALDRFAQFFISPLIKSDSITRERETMESEFQMALPSDVSRKEQLFSTLAQTDHPATKFAWGNLVTLRDNVTDDKLYEELHKFRERHYSAHRMTLAIQARLPLDTLEKYVKVCFANVPNNGLPPEDFSKYKGILSFDTPRFRRIYKIKPVKDVCQIELTWVMASLHHLYRSKPDQYVSWIIGHEGKGSLISYLRKKMWCLDIYCGNAERDFEHSSMYSLFSLSLVLTREGHKNLKQVLNAVFSYINLVRRKGPQKWIYDEIHKIEETNFRFSDEVPPDEYVVDLCENMHFYPPKDYITGSELYFEYDPVSIKGCMDLLTPENGNIIIFDKNLNEEEFDKIEPWFKTKYTDTEIPQDWIDEWKTIEPLDDFHLPQPNLFVTDDFALVPVPEDPSRYPTIIHSDPLLQIWHKPDTKFKLPVCYMNFYYISPLPLSSPENAAMLDLFVAILKQLLVEELYPATAADLNHEILPGDKGLVVKLNGFSEKLPLLLITITKYIGDCSNLVTEELFDVMKGEQLKAYYNTFLKPAKLAKDVRLSILMLVRWSAIDRRTAISGVDFQQFKNFAKHLVKHIYIKCLVQGNMSAGDAIENAQKSVDTLNCGPLLPNTMPQLRVIQMPLGVRCCRVKNFNLTDSNSVVTNYYQSGIGTIKLTVIVELLIMIMEEPLFNQLRTKEQLGYNTFCLTRDTYGILGYSITTCTQADKYTTEYIDERIEAFLKSFNELLKSMPPDELLSVKEALTKSKQCTDIDLETEVNKNWVEITSGEYVFDRLAREVDAISGIKLQDLRKWMTNHTADGGSNLRKLSVQVVGNDGRESNSTDDANVQDNGNEKPPDSPSRQPPAACYGGKAEFPLKYIKDLSSEKKKKTNDYYVTNIEDYKRGLYVFPVEKSTSSRYHTQS